MSGQVKGLQDAYEAGAAAIQEEFDELGLGDASLIACVVIDEALPHILAMLVEDPGGAPWPISSAPISAEALEYARRFVREQGW